MAGETNLAGASAGTQNDNIAGANDFMLNDQSVIKNDSNGLGVLIGSNAETEKQDGTSDSTGTNTDEGATQPDGNGTSSTDPALNQEVIVDESEQGDNTGPQATSSEATIDDNDETQQPDADLAITDESFDTVDIVEPTSADTTGQTTLNNTSGTVSAAQTDDPAQETSETTSVSEEEAEDDTLGTTNIDDETTTNLVGPAPVNIATSLPDDNVVQTDDTTQETNETALAPEEETAQAVVPSTQDDQTTTAAPSDIDFSNSAVDENAEGGTLVATLSASDADSTDFTFDLVNNQGEPQENEFFEINGDQLLVRPNANLDFETQTSVDLNVKVTDESDNSFIEPVIINVNNQDEGLTNLNFTFSENPGIKAEFFVLDGFTLSLDNIDFDRPADDVRVIDDLNFGSGDNTVFENEAGINDFFAARFTSTISIDEGGEWTFGANADDGIIIRINGEIVVDDRGLHDARFSQGSIDLDPGNHEIEVLYFENRLDSTLDIVFKGPSDERFEQIDPGLFSFSTQPVFENAEAGTLVGTLSVEGDVDRFEITEGADDLFEINDLNQLVVREGAVIDFETTASFPLEITAFTANGDSLTTNIDVDVQDVNEAPRAISFDGDFIVDEGNTGDRVVAQITGAVDEDIVENHVFSIVGDNAELFDINDNNEIIIRNGVNLEALNQPTVDIDVRVADRAGAIFEETISVTLRENTEEPSQITLGNQNETDPGGNLAPFNLSLPVSSIDENSAGNALIARIGVEDDQSTGLLRFDLEGPDADNFFVLGGNLRVRPGADIDFENQSELNFTIVVSDREGGVTRQDVTLNVNDLNEGPVDITLSTSAIDENAQAGTVIADINVSDPDFGDNPSLQIVDFSGNPASSDFFEINDNNQLVVRDGAQIDFEQNETLSVNIQATDQGGLSITQRVSISVNDLDDSPVGDIILNSDGTEINVLPRTDINATLQPLAENAAGGTVVANLVAIDPNEGDTHTFEIIGNTNVVSESPFFEINNQNQLVVRQDAIIDFEEHETLFVNVRVTDQDGAFSFERVRVPIEDLLESTPPQDITFSNLSIIENAVPGSVVATLDTIDSDANDSFTYTLSGEGADLFTIDGDLIIVRDGAVIDFETQQSIPLTVITTDKDGQSFSEDVSISVRDINEAPTIITPSATAIDENAAGNQIVARLTTDNPEPNDFVSFEIVGGSDDYFILGDTLRVRPGAEIDHETTESVTFQIRASDQGGNSTLSEITIAINDVSEAPSAIVSSPAFVDENAPAGTIIANFVPVDDDEGDSFTYELVRFNGEVDDNPFFEIDQNGQLTVREGADIDFEQNQTLGFNLRVTDSTGNSITQRFSIDVNDLDENQAPQDITLDTTLINENSASGVTVATLGATDPDQSDNHSFDISGPGAAFVEVAGDRLVVREGAEIDFEALSELDLTVTATDEGGLTFSEDVTLTVNDLNEGPVNLVADGNPLNENAAEGTVVATLLVDDPDLNDDHSFTLSGEGAENFTVVNDQIVVAEGASLDFETAPSFNLTITATDSGGLSVDESLEINLLDAQENQAPIDIIFTAGDNSAQSNTIGPNLVVNGSFELDDVPTGSAQFTNTLTGWTVVGEAEIWDNNAGFQASDGQQHLELDAGIFNDGILQNIQTVAGETYTLSFDAASRALSEGNTVRVLWNNVLVAEVDPNSVEFQTFTVELEGTGGLDQLFFLEDVAENNTVGSFLDNVTLFQHAPTVDEALNVNENAAAGTVVATLTGQDPDAGDTLSFTLVDETGNPLDHDNFEVIGNQIFVREGATIDFESVAQETLNIQVADQNGATFVETVTIDVNDLEELSIERVEIETVSTIRTDKADDFFDFNHVGNESFDTGAGDDLVFAGDGDDLINGGTGNDTLHGEAGNDIFTFSPGDGQDTVFGGQGGGFIDAIELSNVDPSSFGTAWTLTLEQGEIIGQDNDAIALSQDSNGTIEFDDGSTIDFHEIEQIQW